MVETSEEFDQAMSVFAKAHRDCYPFVGLDGLGGKVQVTSCLGDFIFDSQAKAIPHLLGQWPKPPKPLKAVAALTVFEHKLFNRALRVYEAVPEATELRQNYHCTRAVADKVRAAMKAYFRAKKRAVAA